MRPVIPWRNVARLTPDQKGACSSHVGVKQIIHSEQYFQIDLFVIVVAILVKN